MKQLFRPLIAFLLLTSWKEDDKQTKGSPHLKAAKPFLSIAAIVCLLVGCKKNTEPIYPCWQCTVFVYYSTSNPNGLSVLRDYQTQERTCDDARKEKLHAGFSKTEPLAGYTLTTRTQGLCRPAK